MNTAHRDGKLSGPAKARGHVVAIGGDGIEGGLDDVLAAGPGMGGLHLTDDLLAGFAGPRNPNKRRGNIEKRVLCHAYDPGLFRRSRLGAFCYTRMTPKNPRAANASPDLSGSMVSCPPHHPSEACMTWRRAKARPRLLAPRQRASCSAQLVRSDPAPTISGTRPLVASTAAATARLRSARPRPGGLPGDPICRYRRCLRHSPALAEKQKGR